MVFFLAPTRRLRVVAGGAPSEPGAPAVHRDLFREARAEINRMLGKRVKWFGLPIGRRITPEFAEHLKKVVKDRIKQGEFEGPGWRFRGIKGLVSHTLKNYREQWLASSEGRRMVGKLHEWIARGVYSPSGIKSEEHFKQFLHHAAYTLAHAPGKPLLDARRRERRKKALELLDKARFGARWRAWLFRGAPAPV